MTRKLGGLDTLNGSASQCVEASFLHRKSIEAGEQAEILLKREKALPSNGYYDRWQQHNLVVASGKLPAEPQLIGELVLKEQMAIGPFFDGKLGMPCRFGTKVRRTTVAFSY